MNAMHILRQNFVAAESSEKIRWALKHKVCSYSDIVYVNGDRVYYQRKYFKGWEDPVIFGRDSQVVLIRHGGAYHRVHLCQLIKIKDTGRLWLVPKRKQGHIQDNDTQRNLGAVADYEDPYTENIQDFVV